LSLNESKCNIKLYTYNEHVERGQDEGRKEGRKKERKKERYDPRIHKLLTTVIK